MHPSSSSIHQRLMQYLAWFVFGFCMIFILTGVIVGNTKPTNAQEPVAAEAQADEEQGEQPVEAEPEAEPVVEAEPPEAEPTEAEPPEAEPTAEPAAEPDQPETISLRKVKSDSASSVLDKSISFLGIFALLFIAFLMSNNRRRINWKLVGIGVSMQLVFAVFIFYVPGGQKLFEGATTAVKKLLDFTSDGSSFIFSSFVTQQWEPGLINFAFAVLPTIIFFSALMTILYHLGIMQKIVHLFAWLMQKTMGISGAESMSAAANIFVGQTEAPLVVKPYVDKMTQSELMVVMCGGFATVAGGVLAIYVGMLESVFPDIAGHLIAASVMSAPAALVIAKIMYPETETPATAGTLEAHEEEKEDVNVLDAASRGAAEGLKLALNVGAMLLAFIALIAMVNYLIGLPSLLWNKGALGSMLEFYMAKSLTIPEGCGVVVDGVASMADVADGAIVSCVEQMKGAAGAPEKWLAPMISMQDIFGVVFWPFAWIMGVPMEDCTLIAQLLGEKMVINELVAYSSLQQMLLNPDVVLQDRSIIIATYALCGFANFGSIGIQLGGIGGIAPNRKKDLARIALKAMIGGTLAAFMTATIAGILI